MHVRNLICVAERQRAFERRLHLQVPQLGNRNIEMHQSFRACDVVLLQQQLGQPQA